MSTHDDDILDFDFFDESRDPRGRPDERGPRRANVARRAAAAPGALNSAQPA